MFKKITISIIILCSSSTYSQTSYDHNKLNLKDELDYSTSYLTFSINIGAATPREFYEDFYSYIEEFKPVSHTFYNEFYFELRLNIPLFF